MASASLPMHPLPHNSLWEVLLDWGCTWMWQDLRLSGDNNWLPAAIE